MKRYIFILALLFVSGHIAAQIWDFPIKPGMEEWDNISTHAEMVKVSEIPDNILSNG